MFNAKYIWPGIILFVVLFSSPFWLNVGSATYKRPEIVLPPSGEECVGAREFMAAEHMQLLDTWRDMALREEKREYVTYTNEGKVKKVWTISLQNTCMSCHVNKVDFCDKCHESNGVDPYCWDCHVEPRGNN